MKSWTKEKESRRSEGDMEFDHTEEMLEVEISRCNEQAKENSLTSMYWQLNKDVRKSATKDKKELFNTLAMECTKCSRAAKHEKPI